MSDIMKKAAGYVEVKLIPGERNSQTWAGWATRWVDLLIVVDPKKSEAKDREVWLEVRKKKSSPKYMKIWTINAKDAVIYRCVSKKKEHAFAIQFRKEDILYMTGNTETESQRWMKIIRDSLNPPDKFVGMEIASGKFFEASVIDNYYSASCQLFGRYGHLAVCENKLIFFENEGPNVVQEWYLHTIRKFDAFKTNEKDTGKVLAIHLAENSSTGCGVLYFFCPRAVLLLETIQLTIREIFNNLEDERIAQQATLMSLGAMHEVDLEEKSTETNLFTISIPDEILKAKQRMGQIPPQKPTRLPAEDAPFVWKDNELFDENSDCIIIEKADYTPPEPLSARRESITDKNSLYVMTRPRANSCTLELDLPDLTKLRERFRQRRCSLPQHCVTPPLRLSSEDRADEGNESTQQLRATTTKATMLNKSANDNEGREEMVTIGEDEETAELPNDTTDGPALVVDEQQSSLEKSTEGLFAEIFSGSDSRESQPKPTEQTNSLKEAAKTSLEPKQRTPPPPPIPIIVSARRGSTHFEKAMVIPKPPTIIVDSDDESDLS